MSDSQREAKLRDGIELALSELGVPGPDYPAPVSNAVAYLLPRTRAALAAAQGGTDG